jgi:hypothetical protein
MENLLIDLHAAITRAAYKYLAANNGSKQRASEQVLLEVAIEESALRRLLGSYVAEEIDAIDDHHNPFRGEDVCSEGTEG